MVLFNYESLTSETTFENSCDSLKENKQFYNAEDIKINKSDEEKGYEMKTKILTLALSLICSLTFIGCDEQEQELEQANIAYNKVDKIYDYKVTQKTLLQCRNLPEFWKRTWTNEKPFAIKDMNSERMEFFTKLKKKNNESYFVIGRETKSSKPIIAITLTGYSQEAKWYRSQIVLCEIVNPKDELKTYIKKPTAPKVASW